MSDSREARPGAPRPPAVAGTKTAVLVNRSVGTAPRPPNTQARPPAVPQTGRRPAVPPALSKRSETPENGWDDEVAVLSSGSVIAADDVTDEASVVAPAESSSSPLMAPTARRTRSLPDHLESESAFDLLPELPEPATKLVPAAASVAPAVPAAASVAPAVPAAASVAPAVPAAPDVPAQPVEPIPAQQALSAEAQEQLFVVLRAALDASLVPLLEKQAELEARLQALQEAEPRPVSAGAASIAPSLSVEVTPSVPPAAAKPAVVATSYGFVIASPSIPPRPTIEEELANVGPIDVPDFGSNRRAVGRLLLGLLLAIVAAAIAATILSHT